MSSSLWRCVAELVFGDVSKGRTAFFFKDWCVQEEFIDAEIVHKHRMISQCINLFDKKETCFRYQALYT